MTIVVRAERRRVRRDRKGAQNRRSLLALFGVAIAAGLPRPALAHHGGPPDAAPASIPSGLGDAPENSGFADLKTAGAEHQVRAIRHLSGSYRVATADGRRVDFSETDLRFKVDSSALGPVRGRPVIVPAGQVGDRAWVFFASPDEISAFIEHQS